MPNRTYERRRATLLRVARRRTWYSPNPWFFFLVWLPFLAIFLLVHTWWLFTIGVVLAVASTRYARRHDPR